MNKDEELQALRRTVALLQDAIKYACNRLDHDPRGPQQPQVAADLAVARAQSISWVGRLGRFE